MRDEEAIEIGLIADTHGLLRPSVHTALAGVSRILHAGDVGGDEILDELATIAPVDAVRGNTDPPDRPRLAGSLALEIGGLRIHVSHGHELGSPTPEKLLERYAADVIVYGHTHKPLVTRASERLVINPGAAGPRRFDLAPSVARLMIRGGRASVEIIELGA
ncbi:MAG TPA: metallophosphoesterase family protein [Gemmatimonadaceae bacterium]|nr:metallophosphoesterase family protein [Gemmatimonadaceae bacterium]